MQIVHADEVPFRAPGTKHREPNVEFKHLMVGKRGSPQNFELLVARTKGTFYSPRHHHNFDQIRFGLSGRFGDGKGNDVPAGGVGYYPEGAHYLIDCAESEVLLLQFGGASGWGFTNYDQLYGAYPELARLGEFRDGVFFRGDRSNLPPGTRRNQDGYEAMWEHIHGQRLRYPAPRYKEPVIMSPENSAWLADEAQPGVARRTLGVFTERLIEIAQIKVDEGATLRESAPRAPRLLFVIAGGGTAEGREWRAQTVIQLDKGESTSVVAKRAATLLVLGLPIFAEHERALT
jgi:hypothetical protein